MTCSCGSEVNAPYYCYRCQVSYGELSCSRCARPLKGARVFDCPDCAPENAGRRIDQIKAEVASGSIAQPLRLPFKDERLKPTKGRKPCGHPNGERDRYCRVCQKNHCGVCADECDRLLERSRSKTGPAAQRTLDFGLSNRKRKNGAPAPVTTSGGMTFQLGYKIPTGSVELTEYDGDKEKKTKYEVE